MNADEIVKKIEKRIADEGFSDLETMISKYKLGVCWACANNETCIAKSDCVPKWRGVEEGAKHE